MDVNDRRKRPPFQECGVDARCNLSRDASLPSSYTVDVKREQANVCVCVCEYFDERCVEKVEHFSDTIAPQRTRIYIDSTVKNCMPVRSVGTVPQTTTV